MSNGDPFSSHAAKGLNPSFEYDPYSSENYYLPNANYQPGISANITSLEDPDDFYRPFAEPPSSQPDIVVQSVDNDDMMSFPTRPRRASAATGGASLKLASTPGSTNGQARSTQRSASGPAGPRPNGLSAAKSMGALNASPGNRSIKERVKQIEQSRPTSPSQAAAAKGGNRFYQNRTLSSASITSAGAVRSPPRTKLSKDRPVGSSSPRARTEKSNRRPLFGEVTNATGGADGAGYGISDMSGTTTRSSVGSMHQPNAMFARSRSQSDLDASQPSSPTRGHGRSLSQDIAPSISNGSSSAASPTGDHKRNAANSSRIPVPRARRASDIGTTNSATRPRSRISRTETPPNQQNVLSPVLLTSRRYSPPRRLDPNHSVHAMVKVPPPKTSPQLRSTRNRQPVTSATAATASSRLKVAERFKPVSNTTNSRPKPPIPVVDVAERRARLQKNLQGGAGTHQKPIRQDLKNLQEGKYQSQRANWVDADAASDGSSDIGSRKSSTTVSVPLLQLC